MTTPSTTQSHAEQARRDGFFLVEDLLSAEQCNTYVTRLQEYASGERPLPPGMSVQREPALQRTGEHREGGQDVRKVSGLYHDELLRGLIEKPEIVARMRELTGGQLRLFRADALMKPASVGSEKGVHQDSPYWPIEPMSLWSCWIPFDDATLDNGCLTVLPGSHTAGARPHAAVQDDYVIPAPNYDSDDLITVPMRKGTGIFFHSLLVHGSAANVSGTPRRAVTLSYMGPGHRYSGNGSGPDYPMVG